MFIQGHNFGNELIMRCGHVDGAHTSGDHMHQFCELEMVLDGEIEITIEGKKYIAKEGDIAIITPFRMHSFYTPRYVKQLICVFSNAFITDFLPFVELCKSREKYVFHAPKYLWNYLIDTNFQNSKTKLKFYPDEESELIHKLKATFYLILSEYFSASRATGESDIDNTLSRILLYISENYTRDLTLSSVGAALGYSPKYVSNCLKAIPDFNFRKLINSMRIEKAKGLLATTDNSNITIAYECGFASETSFHRIFLDMVGTTPKQYKALHKAIKINK